MVFFFGLKPERPAADTAYGSAANLYWLVNEQQIAPHIPVIDKSNRSAGTLSRDDFTFDKAAAAPAGASGRAGGTNIRRRRPTNLLPDFYNEIGRNPH